MKRNKYFLAAALAVIIIGGGAAWLWREGAKAPVPAVPASISSSLFFDPLVPRWLPEGYAVEAGSYSATNQVLVFSAAKNRESSVAFTEEVFPKNFDVNGFYENNLENAGRLTGAKYPVVFGKAKGRDQKIASITSGDTWILVTMPAAFSEQDIRGIADNLVVTP